jgi:hypothetical protein
LKKKTTSCIEYEVKAEMKAKLERMMILRTENLIEELERSYTDKISHEEDFMM